MGMTMSLNTHIYVVNNSKISDMTPASDTVFVRINVHYIILEWTTSLDTSSRTLYVREGGCPRHVERCVM